MIQCVLRVPLFVVPVLTGICGFVAASIPPKGGTTNGAGKGGLLLVLRTCFLLVFFSMTIF